MAQRVVTQYVSDLSGEELGSDGQTVIFGWKGRSYEVDLSPAEVQEFSTAIGPYLEAARRLPGSGRKASGATTGTSQQDRDRTKAIREWAQEHGLKVSSRGRLSAEIVQAYDDAQRG